MKVDRLASCGVFSLATGLATGLAFDLDMVLGESSLVKLLCAGLNRTCHEDSPVVEYHIHLIRFPS